MTAIDFAEVRRIAALARVGVDEARLPGLARELSAILEHMAVLQAIDATAADAPSETSGAPLRSDSGPPNPMAAPPSAMAPAMRDGFFLVPRLATHEDAAGEGVAEREGTLE